MPLVRSARAATLVLSACVLIVFGAHARSVDDEVLAANEAFYKALSARNADALGKLTAHGDYIAWVSPISTGIAIGWPAVQKVYQRIATHFQTLQVSVSDVHLHVNGTVAWVICKEHVVACGTTSPSTRMSPQPTCSRGSQAGGFWSCIIPPCR